MPEEYYAYEIDLETYFEVYELAKKHGKKPGDSMQEEFEEILKKREKIKLIAKVDKDIDMLTGELRGKGLKVLNLKEIDRKKKNENNKKEE